MYLPAYALAAIMGNANITANTLGPEDLRTYEHI